MLEPADRTVLTELLRPPPGFRLDRVVATTYTLDLVTLVTLPLSFTLVSRDGIDDSGRVDPIALLEALRRHARRITVFCQAGRIAVPKRGQLLFGYLEDSVVEAKAPKGGSFHPKVTVVRYLPDRDDAIWGEEEWPGDDAVRYRLLCGTRNLTFDRSWDTMLVLEGDLATGRTNAFARNRPLAEFVEALPRLAVRRIPDSKAASIAEVADELLRVRFELPEGFGDGPNDLAFWPMGLTDREVWPFGERTDRLMVVSPFIDQTCLDWLKEEGELRAIVSRPEWLDRVPGAALKDVPCMILADGVEGEPVEEGSGGPANGTGTGEARNAEDLSIEPAGPELRGLHAKLFVTDAGWDAHLWTGSANATEAAFTKNVEFLVELWGKKSQIGIDALLGSSDAGEEKDRRVRFRDLLVAYQPPDEAKGPDPIEERLERILNASRKAFVDARLVGRLTEVQQESARTYDLSVEAEGEESSLPEGVAATVRPVSLAQAAATEVPRLSGKIASFPGLAFESVTAFLAVSLTAEMSGKKAVADFVLNLPLIGAPEDRESRLLLSMLSNRERLLRYLLMLLEGDPVGFVDMNGNGSGGEWRAGGLWSESGFPLLEPLLQALASDASRLEDLERLVRDLEGTEEGRKLLPDDFVALWESVRAVLAAVRARRGEGGRAAE